MNGQRANPHRHDMERGQSQASRVAGRGIHLGRLGGVDVHVDWSLLIIFALILFNLGAFVFPQWHPRWSALLVWSVALGAAVLFFASVLAHELSHAWMGRRFGIPVPRITLFIFGGMAHMEGESPSPKAEFWMAIVGPITSIVIGMAATLGGWGLAGVSAATFESDPAAAAASLGPLATLLLWLGPINLLLGVFNMVPGFPLDGGRVLRAILWWRTGDLVRATRGASLAGQVFAWILMGLGIMSVFSGDFLGGLWLVLIGWFLNGAARMSYEQLLVRRALEGVAVSRVMSTRVAAVDPQRSVEELVRDHFMGTDQQAFPVVSNGDLVGLVCLEDVRKTPQDRWPYVSVAEIMTPREQLATVGPQDDAEKALEALARHDVNQLPVLDAGRFLGLVRRSDLLRWLALQGPGSPRHGFAPA